MSEAVQSHPTWDEVKDLTGEYTWTYTSDAIYSIQGTIVGSSASKFTSAISLGLGSGYDGIVVNAVTINDDMIEASADLTLFQTIKEKYSGMAIGENGNLPVFYLNKITNLTKVPITPPNPEVDWSAKCKDEKIWGNIPIDKIVMPSVKNPENRMFVESPLYKNTETNIDLISRYQQLWEFFNREKEEPNITFEQYTTLADMAVDETTLNKILQSIAKTKKDENLGSYSFNIADYQRNIGNSPNTGSLLNRVSGIEDGTIFISYYFEGKDRYFKSGKKYKDYIYILKPDGTITSTKYPGATYVYKTIKDNGDLEFEAKLSKSISKGVSNVGSFFRSPKPAQTAGGKRTRSKRNKNKTRKGGKAHQVDGKRRKRTSKK